MGADQQPHGGLTHRILQFLCDLNAVVGGVVLVGLAIMTVVSVIGRAFFSHPILGDVEVVQLGCAVVVASFLPFTQFQRANLIVDFFTTGASERTQGWLDAFGCLLYTGVLALITWRVAVGGMTMRETGESSMLMNLPLWIPYYLMLPGLALSVVVGLVQTLALASGRSGGAA